MTSLGIHTSKALRIRRFLQNYLLVSDVENKQKKQEQEQEQGEKRVARPQGGGGAALGGGGGIRPLGF